MRVRLREPAGVRVSPVPPPNGWPPSCGRHGAYHGRPTPGNLDQHRGSVAPSGSAAGSSSEEWTPDSGHNARREVFQWPAFEEPSRPCSSEMHWLWSRARRVDPDHDRDQQDTKAHPDPWSSPASVSTETGELHFSLPDWQDSHCEAGSRRGAQSVQNGASQVAALARAVLANGNTFPPWWNFFSFVVL
jgi:hypothetical protein